MNQMLDVRSWPLPDFKSLTRSDHPAGIVTMRFLAIPKSTSLPLVSKTIVSG
jgi:hypothetical protein